MIRSGLLAGLLATACPVDAQDVQWASRVVGFSSQAGDDAFSAAQILGRPNKLPSTGVSELAWMPDFRSRRGEEWIKVGYDRPIAVRQIAVAENARPGAVSRIYAYGPDDRAELLWENADTVPVREKGRMLNVRVPPTSYPVGAIMLVLRTGESLPLHQIDAIGIADHDEPIEAAIRVGGPPNPDLRPENLGPEVNSFFEEVFPVISPDGGTLYFDRKRHPGNFGDEPNDDIWIARLGDDGRWLTARNAGRPLNNVEHNFVCSISPDGNTLLLGNAYHGDSLVDGLSITRRGESGWGPPEPLRIRDYHNLDEYGEYQLAANGRVILMALAREDALGRRDLYASFAMPDGAWSAPLHLGGDVNSPGLEMSPFLAPDMKTLYFSSDGFAGYGSNDMFVARRLDDSWTRWTEPVNLGPGLNSEGLDAYYTVPASGDYAYYASSHRAIGGTDIFRVPLPDNVRPEPVALVTGRVVDASTGRKVDASIAYAGPQGEEAGIAHSTPEDGTYRIVLPYGERYAFRAEAEGYFALEEKIDLGRVGSYREIARDLVMIPLRVGEVIPLRAIGFRVNEATLLDSSFAELDRVAAFLKTTPGLRIEIGGHTNDRCSESFCLELSRKRAHAVARYLTEAGVPDGRVTWRGYGSRHPVADNATEEGRRRNQRVEFTIVELRK